LFQGLVTLIFERNGLGRQLLLPGKLLVTLILLMENNNIQSERDKVVKPRFLNVLLSRRIATTKMQTKQPSYLLSLLPSFPWAFALLSSATEAFFILI